MILLERAHSNIQGVFTNAWLEDDAYAQLLDAVFSLPDDAIQCIGAWVDETTLPTKDDTVPYVQLAISEYVDLLQDLSLRDILSREDIDAYATDPSLLLPMDVQTKILQTAYLCIKYKETDTAQSMITTLEQATKGELLFGTEIETVLYRKMYLMLVFRYAEFMPESRMIEIFSTSLFTLGVFMDLMILPALGVHIRYYSLVEIRRQLSLDYAASIASNKSAFGVNAKGTSMTVQDWMLLFQKKLQGGTQEEFFTVLEADPDLLANPKEVFVKIEMIMFLYRMLVSGFFILEEGAQSTVARITNELEKEKQAALIAQKEVSFVDILGQPQEMLATSLGKTETLQALLSWLATYPTKQAGIEALGQLLASTIGSIPQEHTDVVGAILQMSHFLVQQGYELENEIIYFDEKNSVFRFSTS